MAKNGKFKWGRWLIVLIVLGVAGGGVAWYLKGRKGSDVQFQTAPITRGEITQTVTATGTLNPVVSVIVGSQISGRISTLYADFNTVVTQSQVIAEIDPSTYMANVSRAQADISSGRASLELAQVEARRASVLFTNNLLSGSEYDSAIASLHQSEAAMQLREASLNSAKVDLSRCTIYSPVDGVVLSRSVDVGQTVAASMSAPELFKIASDLTKMRINANVAEADVGGVVEGQLVEFTVDAFPYRTFYGKVTQVRNSPLTVQNVVTYDTVIEVSNEDMKLKPGMTANVSIVVEQRKNAIRLPNAALRFRAPEDAIMPAPTNAVAQVPPQNMANTNSAETNQMAAAGEQGRRRGGPGGGGFGGRQGGGPGGFGGRGGGERRPLQTVYLMPAGVTDNLVKDVKLKPAKVKLGITDGITTEVLEGVSEGDVVVTGSIGPVTAQAPGGQNPFGGGGGGRFPRR